VQFGLSYRVLFVLLAGALWNSTLGSPGIFRRQCEDRWRSAASGDLFQSLVEQSRRASNRRGQWTPVVR